MILMRMEATTISNYEIMQEHILLNEVIVVSFLKGETKILQWKEQKIGSRIYFVTHNFY